MTLQPGDRLVGTRLEHDTNVTPWRLAADQAGANQVLAPFDPTTGLLDPQAVTELIDERTRWVTVPGASNLLGTVPDLVPIIDAAHAVGANVFVDAVALAPHRAIDIAALGVDAIATSPYKWYGPHSGVLWVRPELLAALPIAKVRPGPQRFEAGMPNFEAIAGVEAAARFLIEETMDRVEAAESVLCARLLDGLGSIRGVQLRGPPGVEDRVPTVAFTVGGVAPADVALKLAADRVAVWDGHNYAVEVVEQLGLADSGGVVRAGVVRYTEAAEIDRLVESVARIAASAR
jgi:selenocysteine lyase/cysteine desulfurase